MHSMERARERHIHKHRNLNESNVRSDRDRERSDMRIKRFPCMDKNSLQCLLSEVINVLQLEAQK